MKSRVVILASVLGLSLLFAACSPSGGPGLSAAETAAALNEALEAAVSIADTESWNSGPVAGVSVPIPAGLPPSDDPAQLPRGVFDYDDATFEWVFVEPSDDLQLNWVHEALAYRLDVDWDATAPTEMVEDSLADEYEVPIGATAVLLADEQEVGEVAFTSGWTTNSCAYDEPTGAHLSGYLGGQEAGVFVDRLGFSLADTATVDSLAAGFEGTAFADGDWISAYFDVSSQGEFERDLDCAISGFVPDSGDLAFGLSVGLAGDEQSLDFEASFADVELAGGTPVSVGLNGQFRLNGALAVAFAGALNDADENGVVGDELELTFGGGETMTLEEFLVGEFGWVPFALRLLR